MAKFPLTHTERLKASLSGEIPDRVPVALWRHFPVDDQTPDGLAAAVLTFQRSYDFDLVKVTPSSSYSLRDWGIQDEWRGSTEGTRDYARPVINFPEDWERLPVITPEKEHLAAQLACLRLLTKELGEETPTIQTIFSPLAQAKNLVGKEKLLVHIRKHPEAVHAGLKTITESTRLFIEEAAKTGIAGIFYAVQFARYGLMSDVEFSEFGRKYDMQVLETAQDLWLKMLHIHGDDIMFDALSDYPVEIVNWHDRDTPPTLAEARQRFKGTLCGGLQRVHTMVLGTPETISMEAHQAIEAAGNTRFILGTGCVVPITAPHGNLLAARMSVEMHSNRQQRD
jgi:uroporphyrinogen decarboxylase